MCRYFVAFYVEGIEHPFNTIVISDNEIQDILDIRSIEKDLELFHNDNVTLINYIKIDN